MTRIVEARSASDVEMVRQLFRDYAASLALDLSYQGFASELDGLPGEYAPPRGTLRLALDEHDRPIGCVALRPLDWPLVAELKRLYVAPAGRGTGLGLALTRAALDAARHAGYECVRLDTLPSMVAAQQLYRSLGFRDIGSYRFSPVEGTRYMELDLRDGAGA